MSLQRFAEAVGRDERMDLAEACLMIAQDTYPSLQVEHYLGEIERLALRLGADLAPGALAPKRSRVRAEEAFLFQLALGMARRSVVLSWPTRGEEGGIVVPSSLR